MVSRDEDNAIYGIPPITTRLVDVPAEKITPAEPVIVNTKQISELFTKPQENWSTYL
jgi:hypothetical protein